MKIIAFITTMFVSVASFATFLPSPAISCNSANVSDAGYGFAVTESGSGYLGELSEASYYGSKSLGTENLNISVSSESGICKITVTQLQDTDGNEFKLSIKAVGAGGRNKAKLNMKLDGKRINSLFSDMHCYISQFSFNELCKPNYGGGVYQNLSGQKAAR